MEMYNDINVILETRLKRCLKNNVLNEYLFGIDSMFLREDPRDSNSDHDYFNTMMVYNRFNSKFPHLKLNEKYILEIINQLSKNDFYDIYAVYESLRAQIKIEEKGWSSFVIDRVQLVNLLKTIDNILEKNKKYLEKYSYKKGAEYKNGVYGYIKETETDMYEIGKKSL